MFKLNLNRHGLIFFALGVFEFLDYILEQFYQILSPKPLWLNHSITLKSGIDLILSLILINLKREFMKSDLIKKLNEGPIICAEGYLFAMERRGYLK